MKAVIKKDLGYDIDKSWIWPSGESYSDIIAKYGVGEYRDGKYVNTNADSKCLRKTTESALGIFDSGNKRHEIRLGCIY